MTIVTKKNTEEKQLGTIIHPLGEAVTLFVLIHVCVAISWPGCMHNSNRTRMRSFCLLSASNLMDPVFSLFFETRTEIVRILFKSVTYLKSWSL